MNENKPACDCETDPIGCLEQLFVRRVQQGRIDKGQSPARRPVFLRLHGVAHGTLEVRRDLPDALRVGLFAEARSYPAWVRFSSDLPDGPPERGSTCGIGIKLFDVPGEKLLAPDENAPTADLILQNHDVFFVDDARDMCAFTKASLDGQGDAWLRDHPTTAAILAAMKRDVASVLGTPYWSVLPYGFGAGSCKFKLEPETPIDGAPGDDPAWLAHDLARRLVAREHRFRLLVQRNPGDFPIDRATVPWPEDVAPPEHVATLVLPAQDVGARGQAAYGEWLAYNPWHTVAEHAPLGSIAAARKVVYAASAALRHDTNREPRGEPVVPRPPGPDREARAIVRAAIHPAIGVARVGNSATEWFVGPEVTDPPPAAPRSHRDATGAIKRQAARFRVFGYDADGNVVRELTAAEADITWSAHLVNKKAAWYRFDRALDIPEAKGTRVPLRNKDEKDRARLVIDPGPRSVSGPETTPAPFDTGTFLGTPVYLGELRTDAAGRLLVLGGRGASGSPEGKPILDPKDGDSFNNADGWYDDTSDGPVAARVVVGGKVVPCDPAWVVVAPPNFGPDLVGWRTMADLREDVAREAGVLPMPETVSFRRHVLPVLQRLSGLQWVNEGFAALFGYDGPLDFDDPALLAKLARAPKGADDPYGELRRTVAHSFRPPTSAGVDTAPWPWIYGDGFGTGPDLAPTANLPLPPTWAAFLEKWADGAFEADWDPAWRPPATLDEVPPAERTAMLDRAALHFCLADAFHPGCELTWPMRHQSMFTSTFRVRPRGAGEPEPDLGPELTPELALGDNGVIHAQGPGDLTRWMALPWQMDTAFCRSGYDLEYDPCLPTFWPARVPNQVLAEEDWKVAVDPGQPREARITAFRRRKGWLRRLPPKTAAAGEWMVAHFADQGILERRPGVEGDPALPPFMWVEVVPDHAAPAAAAAGVEEAERVADAAAAGDARWARAGWRSPEQVAEIRALWKPKPA